MSKTVTVGCKLPHGLVLTAGDKSVTISGRNSSMILSNESFGITEVDADFWDAWLLENKDKKAVTSGAIFANSNEKSTKAEGKEKAKSKTGTEQIRAEKTDGVEEV